MALAISDSCPYLRSMSSSAVRSHKERRRREQQQQHADPLQQFMEACPFAKVLVQEGLVQEGVAQEGLVQGVTKEAARQAALPARHDYGAIFGACVEDVRREGRYRTFANLERRRGSFPLATPCGEAEAEAGREVVMWCSNDYLGMGQHPAVLGAMEEALQRCGAGSGGTRNIAGTSRYHVELEREVASLHDKERALLFSSCYVANSATLETLGKILPDCVIYSDAKNHASLIEGIRHSKLEKRIFRHNDVGHLRELLQQEEGARPRLIVFESVYSMDGTVAPIKEICDLAQEFNALTFIDEVHSVGLYGTKGAGVAEMLGQQHRLDIISGTFGKAFGVFGGYVAGKEEVMDALRCSASGFIFTTSLPPVVAAGCLASVRHLKHATSLRIRHHEQAERLREKLAAAGLPVLACESHIIPLHVGDAQLCKAASDILLREHGLYLQPINFPTVPRGSERFRITPSPNHTEAMMDQLVDALASVFHQVGAPAPCSAAPLL